MGYTRFGNQERELDLELDPLRVLLRFLLLLSLGLPIQMVTGYEDGAASFSLDGILNIYQPSWRTIVDNSIDVVNSRVRGDSVVIMANIMALWHNGAMEQEQEQGQRLLVFAKRIVASINC
ncbi:hypothetical protein AWZ03_009077 [Drosophila navojoa]|uniref:Uncharacterized protein n=1 Tax=Drosophila navojoa TaxID=7232 RepID=A0A484B773_DRONA|nr:hypothetical protein AWZ03_009077 [Drosophila navojoa]